MSTADLVDLPSLASQLVIRAIPTCEPVGHLQPEVIVIGVEGVRVLRDRRKPRARRVAPSAAGLLRGAARLLPAGERARYAEEYRSELCDLAQSGLGRVRQLRYGLRQFLRVLPMGFALRSARHRTAAP